MSETNRNREIRYTDDPPSFGNDSAYEETYPDGSVKHECWNSGTGSRRKKQKEEEDDGWD